MRRFLGILALAALLASPVVAQNTVVYLSGASPGGPVNDTDTLWWCQNPASCGPNDYLVRENALQLKQYVLSGGPYLPTAGGVLTGSLTLSADPIAPLQAATKGYVDAHGGGGSGGGLSGMTPGQLPVASTATTATSSIPYGQTGANTVLETGAGGLIAAAVLPSTGTPYLPTAGGAMSGPLALAADPASALQPATKQYTDAADNLRLLLTGGTLSGPLVLNANPTVALGAATKGYIDTNYVPIAGTTMTGALILNADPGVALGAATKQYTDTGLAGKLSLSGGTMAGTLTLQADPTTNLMAATKQYVDGHVSGGGGLSGMTSGQLGVAGSASTITSSVPYGTTGNNTVLETGSGGLIASSVLPPPGPTSPGAVTSYTAVAHQFINAVSTAGAHLSAQPACADIADAGTACPISTGVAGGTLGLLNGNLTFSGTDTFSGATTLSGNGTFSGTTYTAGGAWTFSQAASINLNTDATPNLPGSNSLVIIGADTTSPAVQITGFAGAANLLGYRADGTATTPTPLVDQDIINAFTFGGYDGASWSLAGNMRAQSAGTWSNLAHPTKLKIMTTPAASTTSASVATFESDGTLYVGSSASSTVKNTGAGTVNADTGFFINGVNIVTGKATLNGTVAAPGSVTATTPTYKMLGLAQTITPKFFGAVRASICGSFTDATLADDVTFVLSYGTGTAPANGAAVAGTQTGAVMLQDTLVASKAISVCTTAVITGLTVGTAVWLDLAIGSSGGHAVTFGSTNVSANEV